MRTSAFGMFDPTNGGFGQAPKFPHPSALDLLIERYAKSSKSKPYFSPQKGRARMGRPSRVDGDKQLRELI